MVKLLKPKARAPSEKRIQQDIRLALGQEPDLVLWRNHRGKVMAQTDEGYRFAGVAGLGDGGADLVGVLRIRICLEAGEDPETIYIGRFFALEVKRPGQKPESHQLQWGELVRKFGGFYAVVDSVDAARLALGRARKGETL